MDLELPDGTVIYDIPDGTDPAELKAKFAGKFGAPAQVAQGEPEKPWQPMPQTGSLSDFENATPNPDKWAARIPVDMALGYATGGASLAAGGSRFLTQFAPGLAKLMKAAGTALTAPTGVASAMGGGALEGGLTEAAHGGDMADIAKSTALGGAFGAAGQKVLGPLAKGFDVNPRAQNLIDKGVDVTTGGRISRGARNAEDKLTSLPIVGDAIIGAKNREKESFNRMLVNDALDPLTNRPPGTELIPGSTNLADTAPAGRIPESMGAGPGAIQNADNQISARYDDVLDKMTVVKDLDFTGEMTQLRTMAESLPSKERARFNQIIDESLDTSVSGGSDMMLGQTYKKVFRRLRDESLRYQKSPDAFQQDLGNALHESAMALKRAGQRQNPVQSKRLAEADKAFAKMETVRDAATKMGADDNVFNANQYLRAVAKSSKRQGRKAYSQGVGHNQPIAADAKAVMSQKIPDSGTAGRLMTAGLLGGGTLASGTAIPAIMGGLAGASLYTGKGQKILNDMLFERTNSAARNAAAPLMGLLSAAVATEEERANRD